MKKKLLAFVVIMTLVLSLAACGISPSAENETPADEAQGTETVEPSVENDGRITPSETDEPQNDASETSESAAETFRQDGERYEGAIMLEGDEFANLTISILPDDFPEMDESFLISLLEVHLMNITASFKNQPTIGQPNTSTVVIALNGDAFGVFVIYSISPNTSEDGLYVEVQEQPQTTVEMVIHRTGGSLGQVTVEWRVVGGTATEGLDFVGAGDILTFAEGE